jgi:hypothetical protein
VISDRSNVPTEPVTMSPESSESSESSESVAGGDAPTRSGRGSTQDVPDSPAVTEAASGPAAVASVVFGLSAVPGDMLLSQAYLYDDGHGGYGVGHRGLSNANWTEAGALAEYSLISWLTGSDHTSVPGPEATVIQAVGPDLRGREGS